MARISDRRPRRQRRPPMSVEFIGMIGTQPASEIHPPRGPAIDIDYVRRFAQAHEQSDFDRILIGYFSNGADGFIVAQYAAFVTDKLGLMLAHRPGFVAPTWQRASWRRWIISAAGASRCTSFRAVTTPNRPRMATSCRMTNAMRAPTSMWKSFAASGPPTSRSITREVLQIRALLLGRETAAEAAYPDLLRRLFRGRDRDCRKHAGCLRAVG